MRARQMWVGVALILLGVLMLMTNLGFLSWDFWHALRQLWPVVLISIGLTMLLADTRWVFLGPLLLVAVIVFAAFNSVGMQLGPRATQGHRQILRSASYSKEWEPSITQGELALRLPAGTLNLTGSADSLVSSRISFRKGMPIWGYQQLGGRAVVTLSSPRAGSWFVGSAGYQGDVALGAMVPWEIRLELGAGRLVGDLRGVPVASLTAELGAGRIDLALPDKGLRGEIGIRGGASSVRLRVPRGVGLRIQVKNPLGSHDLDSAGLKKMGEYWVSDDYETALSAYDITVSLGVGRLDLEYVSPPPQI